jgi:iron complex outermembrane receptor protein
VFTDLASTSQLVAANGSNRLDGAISGAGSCNWLAGNLLVGVEADLAIRLARRPDGPSADLQSRSSAWSATRRYKRSSSRARLEWFVTLRGRLGAAVTPAPWLPVWQPCGGRGHDRGTVFLRRRRQSSNDRQQPDTKAGWTAGGGLEARLVGNWTGRIEYLYLDLGSITTVPTPAPGSTVAVAFNSRVTDNVVRLGVNYKFDSSGVIWATD